MAHRLAVRDISFFERQIPFTKPFRFGAVVINYTRERVRRVTFTVPVDWANDLEQVEKAILGALTANELVLAEPPPSVVVAELQDYAMLMRARANVRSADYWRALWALQRDVKIALDKAKILPAVPRQAAMARAEPAMPGNAVVPQEPARLKGKDAA